VGQSLGIRDQHTLAFQTNPAAVDKVGQRFIDCFPRDPDQLRDLPLRQVVCPRGCRRPAGCPNAGQAGAIAWRLWTPRRYRPDRSGWWFNDSRYPHPGHTNKTPHRGLSASAAECGDEFLDSRGLVLGGRFFGLDGFDEVGAKPYPVRGLKGGELGAPACDVQPLAQRRSG